MNVFENIREMLMARFSDWIQVVDPRSNWTLDNVTIIKDVGVDPKQVNPHCVKCVVVNQCWFKNEKGKKPEPFEYNKYSNIVLSKLRGIMGLYHPRCHCQEIIINPPTEKTLKVVCDNGKIDDAFNRKLGLLNAWGGYTTNDKELLKNNLMQSATKQYINGEYSIFVYDKFGFRISIPVSVPGINIKQGRDYKFITGFMVWPNGKIENTTFFGGKIK